MIETLVNGLFLGALLSLVSLGLSVSYAVFRFPNFAHAEFVTVGAYGAWLGATLAGGAEAPGEAALAGAVAALLTVLIVIGMADTLVLRRLLARRGGAGVIIAAFALGLLLRNLVVLLFGPGEIAVERALEMAIPLWSAAPFDAARLTVTEWGLVGVALVLVRIAHLLQRRTGLGRSLRAVAENAELAEVCGIPVPRVRLAAWALAAAGCAAAGGALIMLGPVRPESGAEFMLPALAAVVVGGVRSVGGMLLGALVIGMTEAVTVHLGLAEWRAVASFGVIVLVLVARPGGLRAGAL